MNATHNELTEKYSDYVKKCVREGKEPLNPNIWMQLEASVDDFRQAGFSRTEEKVDDNTVWELDTKKKRPAKSEKKIREAFVQMMIDQGINNSMSLMQRARHRAILGYDERPSTRKQTKPCELCGDILCAWAQ